MATEEELEELRALEASQAPTSDETIQEDIRNQANTGEVTLEDFASSADSFAQTKQAQEDALAAAEEELEQEPSAEQTVLSEETINQINEVINDEQLLEVINQVAPSDSDILESIEQGVDILTSVGQGANVSVDVGDSDIPDNTILGSRQQGVEVEVDVGDGDRDSSTVVEETPIVLEAETPVTEAIVLPVNNTPIIDLIGTQSVAEDGTTTIIFNASDIDNDTLTATVTAENGTVYIDDNGYIVYTPDADYSGSTTITLTVSDGNGGVVTQTFGMDVIEGADAPILAVESTKTVDEDGVESITYVASDVDGTIVSTTASAEHGTVIVNDDGTITYTPDANYYGTDTISVIATDDDGLTTVQTSNITINSINDAPTIDDISSQTLAEDGTKVISFSTSDIEGDTLTSSVAATNGTAIINEDGEIEFTPDTNYNGDATVTLTVDDGNGGTTTQVINVTVTPVNDAPVIEPILTQYVGQDGEKVISFSASDIDGDTLTSSAQAYFGTVTINEDGAIVYTPKEGFSGNDVITLQVDDGNGGVVTKSFNIVVSDTDAPTIDIVNASDTGISDTDNITSDTTPTLEGTAEAGATVVITDENGNEIGSQVIGEDGTYSITVSSELEDGSHTFTVTATDAENNTAQSSQNIIIDTTSASISIDDITYTADSTPVFTGTVNDINLDKVEVTIDGNTYNATIKDDGTWSIEVDDLILDGDYEVNVIAYDVAGNISTSIDESVSIDTSAIESANTAQDAAETAETVASSAQNTADLKETATDTLITAATDAQTVIDNADTTVANDTLTAAEAAGQAAVDSATDYVTDAQAAVDAADVAVTAATASVAAANLAVNDTQDAYDRALNAGENTDDEQAALDVANAQLTTANTSLSDANTASTTANAELTDANATLTAAENLDAAIETATDAAVDTL
ncbi:MAG: tandem-95 repeat protein, partial [Arcobacteraceae bacterium]|nr:tandem-95 repeat protein [Arcobacteraceae bacterium]